MSAIEFPPEMKAQIVTWAQQLLEGEGATVHWPGDGRTWETIADVVRRLHEAHPDLSVSCLRSRIGTVTCPNFPRKNHPTGRIKRLVATPELVEFLTKPRQPGEAL